MYVIVESTAPVDQLAVGRQSEDVQLGAHPELLFDDTGESRHSGEDGYEVIGYGVLGKGSKDMTDGGGKDRVGASGCHRTWVY